MRFLVLFALLSGYILSAKTALENTTCKRCHPIIYKEYYKSRHRKASIYTDPVHNAVWQKHPLKKKQNYTCKKCHTPSDTELMSRKTLPSESLVQREEPISCIYCHSIERIQKHPKANQNILHEQKGQRPTLYSADKYRKDTKITFKEERGFLGLTTKVTGSPFHDINFGNEIWYNGELCMGCHDHKQNAAHFNVCDMGFKKGDTKQTCISCHMPQVQGSATTIKETGTHAYHGIGTLHGMKEAMKWLKIDLQKDQQGFSVTLHNRSNHTLFIHPLRMAKLLVTIYREGKTLPQPSQTLQRVIGKDGKPSSPWLADSVVKDSTLKASERKSYRYDIPLQKGDIVEVSLGYYRVNPNAAKMLGIADRPEAKLEIIKKRRFYQ